MAAGAKREKHKERGTNRQIANRHRTQDIQRLPRWARRLPLKGANRASQTVKSEASPIACALCGGNLITPTKRPVCATCRGEHQGDKPWDNDGEHRINDDYRTNGAWENR